MSDKPKKLRCAIYTRKSTEDGLEQDFNSLDAQREACAAYILSQASEGWEAVSEFYDDGGWSGGSMNRPAITQLLGDVKAGKVDVIVVYKVDRLTRSLADFAKIVEILDENEASFVSVTQSFNTTTSMGRLTLNVLLSFAQFEREVTGERIRDKIAASKKKGMWMGGPIPIGYNLQDRKLMINESEAEAVCHMFRRYTKLKSVPQLVDELAADGYRTKQRLYKGERIVGGIPFRAGSLTKLLHNPIYIGKVRHKDAIYDGEHEAIIDQALFDKVQKTFATNRRDNALGKKSDNPSLLTGLITDPDGRPMSPTQSRRGAKLYRYYTTRLEPGEKKNSVWRMPCGEIERLVINAIADQLRASGSNGSETAADLSTQIDDRSDMADALPDMCITNRRETLLNYQTKVQIKEAAIEIVFRPTDYTDPVSVTVNAELVSRGSDVKLAIAPSDGTSKRDPDPILLRLVAHAFAARDFLMDGTPSPMIAVYSKAHLQKLTRLSYLAPDIISTIIDGSQPENLTGRRILRMGNVPLCWTAQRAMLGFN
ncbi:recombinase family protein [Parasphingorhabdus sp.]|uniref:recombinase family protein n=1 Tax=Parasphingorhabdus sp. TaxID=2709688 RepID=UPI003002DC21